jgi:hypothetical protein
MAFMTRGLDVNFNWIFGRGKNSYKTGLAAIQQSIMTRLKSWKYNCFFAPNDGIDYNSYLDIGTKALLDLDIKRTILGTYGVIRITAYDSVIADRNITITCNVVTIYGQTAILF